MMEKSNYAIQTKKYSNNNYFCNMYSNNYDNNKKYYGKNKSGKQTNIKNRVIFLKKTIFPAISEDKIQSLMIDNESIKYITFPTNADEITDIIMNNLIDFPCIESENQLEWDAMSLDMKMSKLVITDITAGVGGNVFSFAKKFKHVNAIEINTLRYNYLLKNISLYDYVNVSCYNNDSIKLLESDDLTQNIIFFDPPWGGKNYKFYSNLRLRFGEHAMENICTLLFQKQQIKIIVLKLPNNYDFQFMSSELKNYKIIKYTMEKMTIIVLKNYPITIAIDSDT